MYIFADSGESDAPSAFGILPEGPSAGVVVGRRPHRRLLFFGLDWGWDRERVDFALNVLRAALGLHLLEERVRLSFRQVAEIQESLLREAAPQVPGFDVAYKSIPVEEVGGDFCDFVHLGEDLVGFAIGDASGHGLPAALLVRDVVTGLRMGLEKHLRMEYVFSKLNRVIHRSNLSSHYVSAFYGELEPNGRSPTSTPATSPRCCSARTASSSCGREARSSVPCPRSRIAAASCASTPAPCSCCSRTASWSAAPTATSSATRGSSASSRRATASPPPSSSTASSTRRSLTARGGRGKTT